MFVAYIIQFVVCVAVVSVGNLNIFRKETLLARMKFASVLCSQENELTLFPASLFSSVMSSLLENRKNGPG